MLNKIFIILLMGGAILLLNESVMAQSKSKNKASENHAVFSEEADSRNPGQEDFSQSRAKKNFSKAKVNNYFKNLDLKVEEYHERMKVNKKRYQKMERISKKPQYSDPTYFGHKKKPKKRAPGKKKFCKECEIRH